MYKREIPMFTTLRIATVKVEDTGGKIMFFFDCELNWRKCVCVRWIQIARATECQRKESEWQDMRLTSIFPRQI